MPISSHRDRVSDGFSTDGVLGRWKTSVDDRRLYWAAPNVRHPGFRWLTPGAVLAIVVWVAGSVGFTIYLANFDSTTGPTERLPG